MSTTTTTASSTKVAILRRCGACARPIAPGTACIAFPTHHRRCIEAAIERARESA